MKKKILNAAIKLIKQKGITNSLLEEVANNLDITKEEIDLHYREGVEGLLLEYNAQLNDKMHKKVEITNLRTHEKIEAMLLARFAIADKSVARHIYDYLKHPPRLKLAAHMAYSTTVYIWRLAGDIATDHNFYTKRLILGHIYRRSLEFWLENNDDQALQSFLNAELQKAANIGKYKKKLGDIIEQAKIRIEAFNAKF